MWLLLVIVKAEEHIILYGCSTENYNLAVLRGSAKRKFSQKETSNKIAGSSSSGFIFA